VINETFGNQIESFKQMAQQSGVSGLAYIDFSPSKGLLRVKLQVSPPQSQSMLIANFTNVLAQASQMFGIQVKVHEDDSEQQGS